MGEGDRGDGEAMGRRMWQWGGDGGNGADGNGRWGCDNGEGIEAKFPKSMLHSNPKPFIIVLL